MPSAKQTKAVRDSSLPLGDSIPISSDGIARVFQLIALGKISYVNDQRGHYYRVSANEITKEDFERRLIMKNSEIPWVVHVELQGDEVGKLPVFLARAVMYVTAESAKEACYLAERYLKSFQPMEVVSVKPWMTTLAYDQKLEKLYNDAIAAMKKYEQKNKGSHAADSITEAAGGKQPEKP